MNITLLHQLYNDPRFSLTGSRYWNKISPPKIKISPETDYDFVAEFSEKLMGEFLYKGFTFRTGGEKRPIQARGNEYDDGDTIIVLYNGPIQLILKKDVTTYLKVQQKIGAEFYKNYLWKRHTQVPQIQKLLNFLCLMETLR